MTQELQRTITLDLQKFQVLAGAIIGVDELQGVLRNCNNLDVFQRNAFKQKIDQLIRQSLEGV